MRIRQVVFSFFCAGLAIVLGHPRIIQAQARSTPNAQQIERGRYIVDISGCNDCHTAGYGAIEGKTPDSEKLKGDILGYRGPWGTTYATNLRLTMGRLTEDEWVRYGKNLRARPPMPWFGIRAMSETDLRAVYNYIKSLSGASGNPAPAFLPPDKEPTTPFLLWPGVK